MQPPGKGAILGNEAKFIRFPGGCQEREAGEELAEGIGLRDEDKGGAVRGAVYLEGVEKGNLEVGLGLELEKKFPLGQVEGEGIAGVQGEDLAAGLKMAAELVVLGGGTLVNVHKNRPFDSARQALARSGHVW